MNKDPSAPAEPSPEVVSIRFHLASTAPRPDYREMKAKSGEKVYVAPTAALTRMDVAHVRALHSNKRSMLQVVLNRIGAQRAYLLTRDNVEARLAVFIDDKLICAPPIYGPVTDGQLHVVGSFSRKEAERLAAAVNAQPGR